MLLTWLFLLLMYMANVRCTSVKKFVMLLTRFCVCRLTLWDDELFLCVSWIMHMCVKRPHLNDGRFCVCRLTYMCDKLISIFVVTLEYVYYDSFINMCAMTYSDVCWLTDMCATTDFHLRHDSWICVLWLIHKYVCHYSFWLVSTHWYGVAMVSRLLKITGLFCKRAL